MLAALYQKFFDHLPLKRRANDTLGEPPVKQARYCMALPSKAADQSSKNNEKENDGEEIRIVCERKSPGWVSPRKTVRAKFTATSTPEESVLTSPRIRETRRLFDVEPLSAIRPVPERAPKPAKTIPERIFGSFKSPKRCSTTHLRRKPIDNSASHLKYLDEKMAYKRLVELHAKRPVPLFKLPSPAQKKEIPVINLEPDMKSLRVFRGREASTSTAASRALDRPSSDVSIVAEYRPQKMTPAKRVNSLQDFISQNPNLFSERDVSNLLRDCATKVMEKRRLADLEKGRLAALTEHNESASSDALEVRLREYMKITEPPIIELEEEEYVLPELTKEQQARVASAFRAPPNEKLADKFDIQITSRDIATLKGLEWLNDAVINFYMNLIIERSKNNTTLPKVYAFNTFFHFNVTNKRFSILRRWTRKFDLFDYDLVLAPVHLQVHWCMSAVDFRSKEIRYYDSMGSPNKSWLEAFMAYLEYESQDKKKKAFDRTGWKLINVDGIPQQMNGADCGVFACMFAEHLARNAPLAFSQDNMPYFRKKMVIEILEGKLLT